MHVVHSKQTVNLSYAEINTLQTYLNELPLNPRHEGVPWGVSKMIYEPMVCSMQIMHLSCAEINTIFKWPKRVSPW
jgi:hypothetical protein